MEKHKAKLQTKMAPTGKSAQWGQRENEKKI